MAEPLSPLSLIDREHLTELFTSLVAIDSPSFAERHMADFVKEQCRQLGLAIREDTAAAAIGGNAGNLSVEVPGTLPQAPILFAAHLDTVAPACGKRALLQSDGTITSAGDTVLGADDLTAVAGILEAVRCLREKQIPHRPLELLFFVAEEPYTAGSRQYDFSGSQAQMAFVADLEGAPGAAALAAPTILYFRFTIHGRASHAGFAPEAGIHAVRIAAEAIAELPLGRIDENTTVGIGTIAGGLAPNIIPEECTLEGEIRGYDNDTVQAVMKRISGLIHQKAAAHGGSVEQTTEQRTTAYRLKEADPVVQHFQAACTALGKQAQLCTTFGGSDASSLNRAGIPALVFSNGMHRIHSTAEYTNVEELAQTAALFLALATMG